MLCPSCHAEVGDQDRFCRNCGGRVAGTDTVRPGASAVADLRVRTRRPGRLLLVVLVNLGLATGSGVAVYALLGRDAPRAGAVTLGMPRLVVLGQPDSADAGAPAAKPSVRPKAGQRRPARRSAKRAAPAPKTKSQPGPAKAAAKATGTHGSDAPAPPKEQPAPAPHKPAPAKEQPAPAKEKPAPAKEKPAPSKPDPQRAEDAIDRFRAGLNADSIRMVVRYHLPQVRACYDRALKQKPDLAGIVEIRFTISEQGQATASSVHRNTTGHQGLGGCLAVIMKRWRYPKPVGGAVEFVYPFVFSAGD